MVPTVKSALILLAAMLAASNMIDLLADIIAIAVAKVSVVELGLLNSLSSASYLVSMAFSSALSERGVVRLQVLIAFLAFSACVGFLALFNSTGIYALLVLCYLVYPLAQAFSRAAILAYVYESLPGSKWARALITGFIASSITEALCLLAFSLLGIKLILSSGFAAVFLLLLPFSLSLLLVREPVMKIERPLHRIELSIDYLESSISRFLAYVWLSEGSLRADVSKYLRERYSTLPKSSLLKLAQVGFKLGSALMLSTLPAVLASKLRLSLDAIMLVYSVSKFLNILTLLQTSHHWAKAVLPILRPLLWYAIVGVSISNYLALGAILGLILYIGGSTDVELFTLYVKSTRGKGSSLYIVLGEVAFVAGAAMSGYVFSVLGPATAVIAVLLSIPSSISIISGKPQKRL